MATLGRKLPSDADTATVRNQRPKAAAHLSLSTLSRSENKNVFTAAYGHQANRCTTDFLDYRDDFDCQGPLWAVANGWGLRRMFGCTQSLRLTPRISSFFANESLRFAALAAVSVAAWMALGPLLAAALINPNLWAASASARLNVAISSAWAMGGFTVAPLSISVVILKFGRWCEARRFSIREWRVWQYPPSAPPGRMKSRA